jgi:hypothetical protein
MTIRIFGKKKQEGEFYAIGAKSNRKKKKKTTTNVPKVFSCKYKTTIKI